MADAKKLARLLRVRALQHNLKRLEEIRAAEKLASERALERRIADLARTVAPTQDARDAGFLLAAAHYRDRLGQSAANAERRVRTAEAERDAAAEATRAAKRDQTAIEKLIERDQARAVVKAMRALEESPALRKKRHDLC